MANARVELGKAAGKELYQIFKAFQGGSIRVEGQISQRGLKALREDGLERLVSGLEKPHFKVSGTVGERAANFDVAILNGEEHVLSAQGEAVIPENAEGFFENLGKLFGIGKRKAEPLKQITEKVVYNKSQIERNLAEIQKMSSEELKNVQKILDDEIARIKSSVSEETFNVWSKLTEADLYGVDVKRIMEATKSGKFVKGGVQKIERTLAELQKMLPEELRNAKMNLSDEIERIKNSVSKETFNVWSKLTEADIYGLDVKRIIAETKSGKLVPSKRAQIEQLEDEFRHYIEKYSETNDADYIKLLRQNIANLKKTGADVSIYERRLNDIISKG